MKKKGIEIFIIAAISFAALFMTTGCGFCGSCREYCSSMDGCTSFLKGCAICYRCSGCQSCLEG